MKSSTTWNGNDIAHSPRKMSEFRDISNISDIRFLMVYRTIIDVILHLIIICNDLWCQLAFFFYKLSRRNGSAVFGTMPPMCCSCPDVYYIIIRDFTAHFLGLKFFCINRYWHQNFIIWKTKTEIQNYLLPYGSLVPTGHDPYGSQRFYDTSPGHRELVADESLLSFDWYVMQEAAILESLLKTHFPNGTYSHHVYPVVTPPDQQTDCLLEMERLPVFAKDQSNWSYHVNSSPPSVAYICINELDHHWFR